MKNYLFENDYQDEPFLPSPNQLKYKILIKNKKIQKQQTLNPNMTPQPIAKNRIHYSTKHNSHDQSITNVLSGGGGKYIPCDDNADQISHDLNNDGDDIDNDDFIDDDWQLADAKLNTDNNKNNTIHKSKSMSTDQFNKIKKTGNVPELLINLESKRKR